MLYCVAFMASISYELSELSSLTRTQLETLKIHRSMQKAEINIHTALRMRKDSGISRGTHYRILAQAKKNVRESLFTVATAVQLGLIKPDDVQKLVATVSLVPVDMSEERNGEVLALLEALVDRIVT